MEIDARQTGGRTLQEAQEVIEAGHPPMADKVALIDFDGCMYPFGYLFDFPDPLPDMVDFMRMLKKSGFHIVIFTSRLSPKWLKSVGQSPLDHIEYITNICLRDGIPFDEITAEKMPAEFYVDDKAAPFHGNWKVTKAWFKAKYLDI